MSSLPELPTHFTRAVQQHIVGVVRDPEVYYSNVLMDNLAQAIRTYVSDVLCSELSRRNADPNRKGSGVLMSNDILPLILEQLPIEDVFTASRVCGKWRDVAISRPSLWTRLEARETTVVETTVVQDHSPEFSCSDFEEADEEDAYEEAVNVNNLRLLRKLRPRSQTQPLTLTVNAASSLSSDFGGYLRRFLELIAPRLSVLHIKTAWTDVVRDVFDDHSWDFPLLRELVCTIPGTWSVVPYNCPLYLTNVHCPSLTHLDLGVVFQLAGLNHQPDLTFLRTRLDGLERIVPLMRLTPELTRLSFNFSIYEFGVMNLGTTRMELHSAVDAIHDLSCRTQHDEVLVRDLLQFFQSLKCTRIALELVDCEHAFYAVLSGPWVETTQIVLRNTADAVEIIFTDAARRTLTIRLLDDVPKIANGLSLRISDDRQPINASGLKLGVIQARNA